MAEKLTPNGLVVGLILEPDDKPVEEQPVEEKPKRNKQPKSE